MTKQDLWDALNTRAPPASSFGQLQKKDIIQKLLEQDIEDVR
jgi:hypothetical protein